MIRCAIVGRVQFDCSANKKDLSMSAFWLFVLWLTDSLFCFLLSNFCMYSVCVLALCFNLCSDSLIFCLLALFCVLTLCFLFGSDPLFFIFLFDSLLFQYSDSLCIFLWFDPLFLICVLIIFFLSSVSLFFVCVLPSVYLFVFWFHIFHLLTFCVFFVCVLALVCLFSYTWSFCVFWLFEFLCSTLWSVLCFDALILFVFCLSILWGVPKLSYFCLGS